MNKKKYDYKKSMKVKQVDCGTNYKTGAHTRKRFNFKNPIDLKK